MNENFAAKPEYGSKSLNSGNSRSKMDKDPIISKFHRAGLNDPAEEEDNGINDKCSTSWITSMINDEKRKVEGNAILNDGEDLHLSKSTLNKCDALVKILADIIKLEFVIHQSWYIRSLYKSVLIQFEVETAKGNGESAGNSDCDNGNSSGNQDDGFYKDLSLKCIKKCEKSSLALESLSRDIDKIRYFIMSSTVEDNRVDRLLQNSMTLLLECWIYSMKRLRRLRMKIAGIFVRSKLLLIDHELVIIWHFLQGQSSEHEMANNENEAKLRGTIKSYRAFIKIFIQQLEDSEAGSPSSSLFEECLHVFLDVESMYSSLNLNWLLNENKALQERLLSSSPSSDNDRSKSLPVIDETKEIEEISSFVNSIVDASMLTHDLTPINSSDSEELSNGGLDRLDERRLSSSTSDMSLMMQRTSLQKQLPTLLTAFNNARRLEQELQNACKVDDNKHNIKGIDSNVRQNDHYMSSSVSPLISQSSTSASPSPPLSSSFVSAATSQSNIRTATLPLSSSSSLLETQSQTLKNNMSQWLNQPRSGLSGSKLIPTNHVGFHSNVLNTLYGIGGGPTPRAYKPNQPSSLNT
ncbi:Mdm36p [Saccharomyces cerevisiae x Saccharomyces kudriavzevii VIN7]|uniref:Mdm36p n=1 Tax=Saccharomyces cerevisiae x Saccharomyces kudriavzevii (strain VIN7) TaxID=1095631 RepID=H0H2F3_SACCK|nr:Mdm36p [Saccharomyces cerevisiae x Saccharomyces kudriavzevii VIN7]